MKGCRTVLRPFETHPPCAPQDEGRPLIELRKFLILRRPRRRPSQRTHGFDPADSKFLPRLVAKPIASTPAPCKRRSNSVASTADIGLDHMAQLHRPAQGDRQPEPPGRRRAPARRLCGSAPRPRRRVAPGPRGCRGRGSRAGRPAGLPGPWRTACADPAHPVPPVLSGRDQASATPSIAISHPLTSADARKITIRIWQLHDCLFVKPPPATWGPSCSPGKVAMS
jgi:hypothetical protein